MKTEGISEVRPGYFVTTDGRVFSEKYGRRVELKQSQHKGYRRVCFSHENRRQHHPVHRLVAEAFIPNPDHKPFVNHLDGNKQNNIVKNLAWCTASENQRHAYGELNIRNGHTGYTYAKLYPKEELRNRLVELGIPRWKHNLAELGEMLPAHLQIDKYQSSKFLWSVHWTDMKKSSHSESADTEADARAKMLIYLLENKLIEV